MKTKNIETLAKHIRWIMDRDTRLTAAAAVAGALQDLNPNFDYNEFYTKCGVRTIEV